MPIDNKTLKIIFIAVVIFCSCNKSSKKPPPHTDTLVSQELRHWDKGKWEMRTCVQIRTYPPSWNNDGSIYIITVGSEEMYSFKNVFDSSIISSYDTISINRKPLYELAQHIIDTMRNEKNKIEAERKLIGDTLNRFYDPDTSSSNKKYQ